MMTKKMASTNLINWVSGFLDLSETQKYKLESLVKDVEKSSYMEGFDDSGWENTKVPNVAMGEN